MLDGRAGKCVFITAVPFTNYKNSREGSPGLIAGVPPATPTKQAVQDSWMGLVTRRAAGVWVFVSVFGDPFHAYKRFIRWDVSTVY